MGQGHTLGTSPEATSPWQHLPLGDTKTSGLQRHSDERVKPDWTAGEERDVNPPALGLLIIC